MTTTINNSDNRTPPTGPTGIDFIVRQKDYPWTQKFIDHWAGLRDGARLASHQQHRKPPTGPDQETATPRPQTLTPWANARLHELTREEEYEELIGATIADPITVELALVQASIPTADADAATAKTEHSRTSTDGPAPNTPTAAGEAHDPPEIRAARRADEHTAALAAANARAAAADAKTRGLRARVAELQEQLDVIRHTVDHRHADAEAHTRTRLDTYARGIARRHPDAPVIAELTEHLTLPPRPKPRIPLRPPTPDTPTPATD